MPAPKSAPTNYVLIFIPTVDILVSGFLCLRMGMLEFPHWVV